MHKYFITAVYILLTTSVCAMEEKGDIKNGLEEYNQALQAYKLHEYCLLPYGFPIGYIDKNDGLKKEVTAFNSFNNTITITTLQKDGSSTLQKTLKSDGTILEKDESLSMRSMTPFFKRLYEETLKTKQRKLENTQRKLEDTQRKLKLTFGDL